MRAPFLAAPWTPARGRLGAGRCGPVVGLLSVALLAVSLTAAIAAQHRSAGLGGG